MPTLNSKGLIQPDEDPYSANIPGGTGGPADAPINSALAGQTPTLAGGAVGVQRQDYGGAIADAGKQYAFNPKWAAVDQQLQRQIANAAFDRTNSYNSLNQGYTQATGEAKRQDDLAQKAMSQAMSSRGQGFGGEKLNETGRIEGDYQRYINQLVGQYQGGIANAENTYGRTLGEIAGQRETNWQTQGAEETAARIERERVAAEAKARADEAARQQTLQQQYIDSINQQNAQNAWYQQQQVAHANGIGSDLAGRLGDLFSGVTGNTTTQQLMAAMNGINDLDWLTQLYSRGLPEPLNTTIRKQIVSMNTPNSPAYTPQPVGHNDNPYGFYGGSGGMAL